jgi:hypothetical protein
MSELEYIQHSVDDTRLAVKQWNIEQIRINGCRTTLLDNIFDAMWVELTFLNVVENSIVCSRFMSRVDFPGLWFMAKFLDKMYKVCQTPETCVKRRKSTQTLISEGQCVMKWVEPALENERYQRGRIGDSCLGIHFFR